MSKTNANANPMDGELGHALAASGTSNAWSTLEAVAVKVSKRVGRTVSPRELDDLMVHAGDKALLSRGVWRTSFGAKYMPIILVNPAFGRTAVAASEAEPMCSCGAGTGDHVRDDRDQKRYFSSQDYNAGRHAVTTSKHKASCLMWRPPSTSHMHSWRRRFS